MIEELAYQYASLSEANPQLVSLAIAAVGAVIAAFVTRSTSELRRAPYFAVSGLLFLLFAIVSMFTSAFIVQAIVGEMFWVIITLEVLATAVFGFFLGRIAMARSRDAYGHGRAAVLAFIPFANFWLLLTPSKTEVSANRVPTIPLLTGGLGVLSGFVMLAGGIALNAYSQVEAQRAVESAAAEGVFVEATLDRVLVQMAVEVATPMTVDEVTTLLRMEADGDTLRYVYEISSDPEALSISMRTGLIQQNCTYDAIRAIIEAGATIEHLYLRRDRSEVGTVTVTRAICGY
jgi:uncharacterized membrane protein YhaH (DUF805 family)